MEEVIHFELDGEIESEEEDDDQQHHDHPRPSVIPPSASSARRTSELIDLFDDGADDPFHIDEDQMEAEEAIVAAQLYNNGGLRAEEKDEGDNRWEKIKKVKANARFSGSGSYGGELLSSSSTNDNNKVNSNNHRFVKFHIESFIRSDDSLTVSRPRVNPDWYYDSPLPLPTPVAVTVGSILLLLLLSLYGYWLFGWIFFGQTGDSEYYTYGGTNNQFVLQPNHPNFTESIPYHPTPTNNNSFITTASPSSTTSVSPTTSTSTTTTTPSSSSSTTSSASSTTTSVSSTTSTSTTSSSTTTTTTSTSTKSPSP